MSSIFDQSIAPVPLGAEARLERELEHLRQRKQAQMARPVPLSYWIFRLAILALAALFLWDAFAHATHRAQAIRAYLYIHAYGDPAALAPLRASGLLTAPELQALDAKRGDYRFYFQSPAQAEAAARSATAYAQELQDLHQARVDRLHGLSRLRYYLFIQFGIHPPTEWRSLEPKVDFSS